MFSRTAILATCLALVVVGVTFAIWPGLDLAVARGFYANGFEFAASPAARRIRSALHYLPVVVALSILLLYLAKRLGAKTPPWATLRGASVAYLLASLLLGPGLLVNVVLKDHWGRPRPVHVIEFGGTMEFRPWRHLDGACVRNCSFVSGETAGAAWLLAPAFIAPPPFRVAAIGGALFLTAATSLGRIAFGGHFLSDVLFAALITLLTIQIVGRLTLGGATMNAGAQFRPPSRLREEKRDL